MDMTPHLNMADTTMNASAPIHCGADVATKPDNFKQPLWNATPMVSGRCFHFSAVKFLLCNIINELHDVFRLCVHGTCFNWLIWKAHGTAGIYLISKLAACGWRDIAMLRLINHGKKRLHLIGQANVFYLHNVSCQEHEGWNYLQKW